MNEKARINGDGAEEERESLTPAEKCAREAADFLQHIREGEIRPQQCMIVFFQPDQHGSPSFGMMTSGGDIFQQQGLLNTAIAHLSSIALGGGDNGSKH